MPGPGSKQHVLGRRILLLAGAVGVAIVLSEIGLAAWYGALGTRGPYEMSEPWGSPFVSRVRGPAGSLGLRRSRPTTANKPPRTYRILSYGDSIAAGYRIAEDETYAILVEAALRADAATGEHVEVLTMARGHSPSVHSFHVRADVPTFEPDGIVMQIELVNDVSDEALTATSGTDADGLPLEIHGHRYALGWNGHLLSALPIAGLRLDRSLLYAKVSQAYGRLWERMVPNPIFAAGSLQTYYSLGFDRSSLTAERLDEGFDRIIETLVALHGFARARDLGFVVLLVPSRHAVGDDRHTEFARGLVERAESRLLARGVPVVSPHAELRRRGASDLFMDFCHPTAEGNAVLAEALQPTLRRWLAAEAPSARADY